MQIFTHKCSFLFKLTGCLVLLSSCGLSSRTITAPTFEQIPIGCSVEEATAIVGSPYRITNTSEGIQSYRYLERIQTGPNQTCQNIYILTVSDGQIIDKQKVQENSSLNFRSP